MQSKHEVEQGWKFAAEIMGVDVAAQMGQEYVNVVEAAIEQLEKISISTNTEILELPSYKDICSRNGVQEHLM